MKILFIGDPHIKITRFELGKTFLNWLDKVISAEKPDLVVNLGDTFDTHAVIRSEVMTEFMRHVYFCLNQHIPYVYVVGNHDMFKPNDSTYHALSHLKGTIDGFHIVDTVADLFDITFVPYIHEPSDFPKNAKSICVAHQSFLGADYGSIVDVTGVDPSSISGCDIIISGHIHKRQALPTTPPVIYPGSPFSQSASDVDQIKGLTLFDSDTFECRFFECPLPKWRKLTAQIEGDLDITNFLAALSTVIQSQDHVVIELTGSKMAISKLLNSDDYKRLISNMSVSVKTIFNDRDKKSASISSSFSIDSILEEYFERVYSGDLDRAALKSRAMDLLNSSHGPQSA